MPLAIIGLGNWGKNLIREFSGITTISYCCSKGNKKNILWLKKNFSEIKHTKSFKKILDDHTINSIVITTPINTHYDLSSQALKAGKNVFVEKPISCTLSQAKNLINLAQKRKLLIFVGFIFLYHPILKKIKSLTHNDPIQHMKCSWEKCGTFDEDIILNLVSHQLSIAQELIGIPSKISFVYKQKNSQRKDIILLESCLKNKKRCIFEVNRISNIKRWSVTIFTQKNIYLWDDNFLHKFNKHSMNYKKIYENKKNLLQLECKEFLDQMNKKNISYENVNTALQILKTIKKIRLR